jgi:hypothetical protein
MCATERGLALVLALLVALPVARRKPPVTHSFTRAVKPRRARRRERLRSSCVLAVGRPAAVSAARSGTRVTPVPSEPAASSSGEALPSW